jgi:protein disulfide-isomerase
MVMSIFSVIAVMAHADALWTDDFAAAKIAAKTQNRFMLLDFTGSDWCGWCIKLNNEVFSKDDFKKYAEEKLVCVIVDFPRRKSLKNEIQMQNFQLQDMYQITGYPTVILLDPNGQMIGRTGYLSGGARQYVEHLESIIGPHTARFGAPSAPVTVVEPDAASDASPAIEVRTWTSVSGNTVKARYHSMVNNLVELHRDDGTAVRVDFASLSTTDQNYLRSIQVIP